MQIASLIQVLKHLYQKRGNFKEDRAIGKHEILGKTVFENCGESKLGNGFGARKEGR